MRPELEHKTTESIVERIKFMTNLMNKNEALKSELNSQGLTDEGFELLNKKLWA